MYAWFIRPTQECRRELQVVELQSNVPKSEVCTACACEPIMCFRATQNTPKSLCQEITCDALASAMAVFRSDLPDNLEGTPPFAPRILPFDPTFPC